MAPTPGYVVSETRKRKNLYSTLESSSSDEDVKQQILNHLKLRSKPKQMYSYQTDSDNSMNGFEDENINSPQPGPSNSVRINLKKLRDPQALYENSFLKIYVEQKSFE